MSRCSKSRPTRWTRRFPAPSAGVLKEIKVTEGQTVPIQTVVAVIDAAGRGGCRPRSQPGAVPRAGKGGCAQGCGTASCSAPLQRPRLLRQPPPPAPTAAPAAACQAGGNGQKIRSSPLVRKLAKEHNVDLASMEGSGAGGRISKKDILAARGIRRREACGPCGAPAPAAAAPSACPGRAAAGRAAPSRIPALENAVPRERIYFGNYEAQPMSMMRQRIAEHMVASKRVSPHVYSIDEADMTRIAKIRERSKAAFEAKYGTKLTFMPFFVRACVEALARLSDGQRVGRRGDGSAAPRNQRGHRRGARLGPDRAGAEERRGEKFPGPRARHERSRRARPRQEAEARGSPGRHFLDHQSRRLRRPDGACR